MKSLISNILLLFALSSLSASTYQKEFLIINEAIIGEDTQAIIKLNEQERSSTLYRPFLLAKNKGAATRPISGDLN